MTAEGSRQIYDTQWQSSAYTDKHPGLEALYHDLEERLAQVENEIRKRRVWSDSIDTRLQFLESCHRQFPGRVTQKELQETEESKKLKEKIKELEARNKELLSKAVSAHKHSENMNEPLRLSAVLQMYEILRLQDWEKFRTASHLSYKTGSFVIKSLFDACENDIRQRTTKIFEVLDISLLNDSMINCSQGMMQEIRNLFKYSYCQNDLELYSKIIMDPPVKAVWNLNEGLLHCVEHVDKKDCEHWRKPAFLWPIMKCEEQLVVKGVVWDEK